VIEIIALMIAPRKLRGALRRAGEQERGRHVTDRMVESDQTDREQDR
jgi:hypothetical protein